MKRSFARGVRVTLEAIPEVLDIFPHSSHHKIEVYPFKSKATVGNAWSKTGVQLRSTLNTFAKAYEQRAKARIRY